MKKDLGEGKPPRSRGNMEEVRIDFQRGNGLIPAIVQDWRTGEVLMVAYMSPESWAKTRETGHACFWSRSRKKLWLKGETSGNVQIVKEVFLDCDNDALLLKVEQTGGAACHTGYRSCFYRRVADGKLETVGERVFDPEEVYGV
jgi:phosphoribosyl-AMP cyclohydrolase